MAGRRPFPREPQARRAVEFIRRSLAQRPTLAEIARSAGLSPFQLHRAFKRYFHETPAEMVTRLELERAKAMLLLGTPVKQVAAATGYRNPATFSRRFRQLTGKAPSRWL